MPGLTHAYYSLNGQIQGERNISTGEYTHYSTDALGSVSPMSGDKFDRCRYKPYGATLAGSPGTFGWVGSWGYAATGRSVSSHYVRARHYSTATRAWTTVDQPWPDEAAFVYVNANPPSIFDPTGNQPPAGYGRVIKLSMPKRRERCCDQMPIHPHNNPNIRVHPHIHYGSQGCNLGTDWRLHDCEELYIAAKSCGIGIHSFCGALYDGKCCEAASKFGVDPACLCAIAMSERYYWDNDPSFKRVSDQITSDPSVGCAQLRAGELAQWIGYAKKQGCDLYFLISRMKYYPAFLTWSHDQIRHVLLRDCEFSIQVRALQMRVSMTSGCNPKGARLDCEYAMEKWTGYGPLWKKLVQRGQCLYKQFGKLDLCK